MPRHLEPGPDHPISIVDADHAVVVTAGGQEFLRTRAAKQLSEATYPPVYYFPADAFATGALQPSTTRTHCPYKGEADYFDIKLADGRVIKDAVWRYNNPYPAVTAITGYLAFYPNKVDGITAED